MQLNQVHLVSATYYLNNSLLSTTYVPSFLTQIHTNNEPCGTTVHNRELVVNIDKKELGTDKKPVGAYLLNKKEARALILHTTH